MTEQTAGSETFDDVLRHVPPPVRFDAAVELCRVYAALTGLTISPAAITTSARAAVVHAKRI